MTSPRVLVRWPDMATPDSRTIELHTSSLEVGVAAEMELETIAEHSARTGVSMAPLDPDLLVKPRGLLLEASVDGRAAGIGGYHLPTDLGLAIVCRLYVRPWARRLGVATTLMAALEGAATGAGARYAWAEVARPAVEAMAFWVDRGYEMVEPPPRHPSRSRAFVHRLI